MHRESATGPAGVIIAAGNGIRQGPGLRSYLATKSFDKLGSVLDVTPTLLYLMDLPVGEDMKSGGVMEKVVNKRLLRSVLFLHNTINELNCYACYTPKYHLALWTTAWFGRIL